MLAYAALTFSLTATAFLAGAVAQLCYGFIDNSFLVADPDAFRSLRWRAQNYRHLLPIGERSIFDPDTAMIQNVRITELVSPGTVASRKLRSQVERIYLDMVKLDRKSGLPLKVYIGGANPHGEIIRLILMRAHIAHEFID